MLRELIAWVLNNYLGKYIGNLNTAQLTVALLSGEVELENLPLRTDALRHLGLPLQAICGTVGKIKLQIPVRQFRTAPWCILIENVYIVIGPINLDEWNANAEEQAELDYKLSRLDGFEAKYRANRENTIDSSYYASSYSGWLSYGTSLVSNIVENLELKIKNVHIRYEDSITVPAHRFTFGITIESLSARSCDSNWQLGFNTSWNQDGASFKLVELASMSFYWDPLYNHETLGNINSNELAAAMDKLRSASHQFVVSPVSVEAHLKKDRSETPLRTRIRPRYGCDLIIKEIQLTLNDWQYNQMVTCIRSLEDIAKYRRFRLLRPEQPINENAKAWWLYAARCHGFQMIDKNQCLQIAKDNLMYLKIYSNVVINQNETLSSESKELKDKVERERSYDELTILRLICLTRIPSTENYTDNSNQGRSMLVQWFPQWWGWYNSTNRSTSNHQNSDLPTSPKDQNQLEDEILNALAGSVEANSILKRDAVFCKFDFTLERGTLDICSGSPCTQNILMLQLQFENLLLSIESRPQSGSHFVGLSLGSVLLKDYISKQSEFPDLIKPQTKDESLVVNNLKRSVPTVRTTTNMTEPLFEMNYERKPLTYNTDYRLLIKSQSLDIVFNTDAFKWLVDFVMKPHQVASTRNKIEAMKNKTKMELIKNWENIIEGDLSERKRWTLEIDISAPQIIFAESFNIRNGIIVVTDFGRLQLTNNNPDYKYEDLNTDPATSMQASEEEDDFMTPCSTPPGSEASQSDSLTLCTALSSELPEIITCENILNEQSFRNKLYDSFNLNLTDLQVLVCKSKERWSFASTKGSSLFHVLDRFSISLQVERRAVCTIDPQFPSLTLSGSLPKLIAHVNEHKIAAITQIFTFFTSNQTQLNNKISQISTHTNIKIDEISEKVCAEGLNEPPIQNFYEQQQEQREASKLIILQFAIDQMSLEVQSRGRSIAELQVTGVKAGFIKRPEDTSLTLSVHGLLLVDAIQSFGPDFELLIASHRHVGIDSISGSLKQSEPCSPCSPESPDPMSDRRPTSPHTISKALNSLQTNSIPWSASNDLDALITIEILLITPKYSDSGENLHIANIQFNNLDIIANQETIVELLSFVKRVFPKINASTSTNIELKFETHATNDSIPDAISLIRTEITFDFHRLNVLVLRALMRDNFLVGRKVGTFTMSEARIHATLGSTTTVEGSLGGLQVLDLTPEGTAHQRILSVGKDPLTDLPPNAHDLLTSLTQEIYAMGSTNRDEIQFDSRQALSFHITKNLKACVSIQIRMASVWYTHCARFMQELSWCATEFKHYLKNLARSIREKAADMAMGLVQHRGDLKATQKSYDCNISDPFQQRHRIRLSSISTSQPCTTIVKIRLDIVLDTPVLVLPRSSCSPQVFVAHLGKISVSNIQTSKKPVVNSDHKIFTIDEKTSYSSPFFMDIDDHYDERGEILKNELETYIIDVRNMNLYSLDTTERKSFLLSGLPKAEDFYSCQLNAVPVLHDTAIRLEVSRIVDIVIENKLEDSSSEGAAVLKITGCVVKPLNLSLSRTQYEQLLETIETAFKIPSDLFCPPTNISIDKQLTTASCVSENEKSNQPFFELDTKFKRQFFNQNIENSEQKSYLHPKVQFDLPTFIIQLKNELNDSLIEICFLDFKVNYEKININETNIKVSLRSLLMEDLLQPDGSKQRTMVISSSPEIQKLRPVSSFSSRSCPNLIGLHLFDECMTGSLPENLEPRFGGINLLNQQTINKSTCPVTPPPSPQPLNIIQDNLVLYTAVLINPYCKNFETQYNSMRQSSSIDFNSLDLVISVQSWFVLLNFFGLLSSDDTNGSNEIISTPIKIDKEKLGNSELDISIRSLTLVFTNINYEIAKANVSNVNLTVSTNIQTKIIEGKLGSISLIDLTAYGTVYRERFWTNGNEALNFLYEQNLLGINERSLNHDAKLKIHMSSVRYVHTKRFVAEIQAFITQFQQLQTPVLKKIKPSGSTNNLQKKPIQLGLEIQSESPIILLPLSSQSEKVLVANLGEFSLENSFHWASENDVISVKKDLEGIPDEILDVMNVNLLNTDIFAGERQQKTNSSYDLNDICMDMGSYLVLKKGSNILNGKCHLKLIVERNLDSWKSHNVPDFSVRGTLSRLEAVLDIQKYILVRGFLSNNLGEPIDDLSVEEKSTFVDSPVILQSMEQNKFEVKSVWTNTSITLDLQDVSIRLQIPNADIEALDVNNKSQKNHLYSNYRTNNVSLACINFIKSSLKIDSFSDGSQDIDLISQEILITDTRFSSSNFSSPDKNTTNNRNVFTNILQPINYKSNTDSVQAEIHSRRRSESLKYTILLNNMRLMAILDWLECVRDFLSQNSDQPKIPLVLSSQGLKITDVNNVDTMQISNISSEHPIELVLNITDSELVFVETPNQWDTSAVILKSTTIVSYRPANQNKVMSINLNNLEVFSCILGFEEDTALSIIDPVTINLDLERNKLDCVLQKRLCIRLSYHDVKMFSQMLESLPNQTRNAKQRNQDIDEDLTAKLRALGFTTSDCINALEICNNQLNDAALWLIQNAKPEKCHPVATNILEIHSIEIRANCVSICVIDDCKDADVPLLELSLSKLEAKQELSIASDLYMKTRSIVGLESGSGCVYQRKSSMVSAGYRTGYLKGIFAIDYYNRAFSGWEPLIEPWKFLANWSYSLGSGIHRNRIQLNVTSDDILKLNITSTILDLYQLVRNNWTEDYYGAPCVTNTKKDSLQITSSPLSYRRRSPFVPFAIKNDIGARLWFTTFLSAPELLGKLNETLNNGSSKWSAVEPGEVQQFSFGPPNKLRHFDSHKLTFHQIGVRVEGWTEVGPVSVDKVGVFFRHARFETIDSISQTPKARIVIAVTLEGSAHKLVTIRSALRLINKLSNPMLLKMEHLNGHLKIGTSNILQTAIISSNSIYSVPLSHVHAHLFLRPLSTEIKFENTKTMQKINNLGAGTSDNITKVFNGNEYWNKYESTIYQSDANFTNNYQFCEKSLHWKDLEESGLADVQQELRTCKCNREKSFRFVAAIKREGYPTKDSLEIPGHSITLWPPIRLINLLPCDILYKLPTGVHGRISPSDTVNVHDIDLNYEIKIILTLDSYPGAGFLSIPADHVGSVDTTLRLTDIKNRVLNLSASILVIKGSGMQISISAPYWLVNRTGLPLVFRQEGVSHESSGQFTENEQARLISPLMYSISDADASPALTIRLGKRFGLNPPWCQPFNLHKDILNRQLQSGSSNEIFIIGVEVRIGRGRYYNTSVVTFSPRFQLYNRSSYKLQFAQKHYATAMSDSFAKTTYIEAVPGCHLPFHWPRLDKKQELCLRLPDVENCLWSGGFPIHETQSLNINIRNLNGDMQFIRVEIILQGATFYLIFGDSQALPPPIRIDNYSDVAIKFYQPDCKHQWRSIVRAHSSIAYALDEPMGAQSLYIEAPGGFSHKYSLDELGKSYNLTYENFIYISFTGTFQNLSTYENYESHYHIESQQLVLTVIDNRVILSKKKSGDRSQLWRMNKEKQLEHEGSSPPTEPGNKFTSTQRFVLDLEKAPQPMNQIGLVVRPPNTQRLSTQTWHFTKDGRLMCEHANMCVQARGGFFGLRPGSDAVLGMIVSDTHVITETLVPLEQAIERQKLRPGSGFLSILVSMDGPIKTIQIKDIKSFEVPELILDPTWKHVSHILSASPEINTNNNSDILTYLSELHVNLKLSKGLGISIISNRPCEELVFISLENILMEVIATSVVRSMDLSVGHMQVDNQLFETQCPVMLYTIGYKNQLTEPETSKSTILSALHLSLKLLPSPNKNAVIYDHFIISVRPLAIYLEERLILRLAIFLGLTKSQPDPAALPDESDYEAQRVATKILAANAKRYYFGDLQIVPSQIRLSVITASKLSMQLSEIKKKLGLTLLKFEDAIIEFEKFTDRHHFETLEVYFRAMKTHYKQELKWQAASILGSVDFLGNPFGLASDLSEGVSSLIFEGSVKSLVKNVTHGISNSTAKLTESISDGLGRVVLDEQDIETRQRILEVSTGTNSTGDHLKAGIKGFGFGLLGGVTSIVKHTYSGAQSDGLLGFINGLGIGIIGTVTKPVIGVLDLASETANAVRETSKTSNRTLPDRKRLPRCVTGAPGGLLPLFSMVQSKGQQHLFLINKRDFSELFMAYEPCLLERRESQLRLLVSTENIWVFSRSEESTTIIFSYHLSELISCHPVSVKTNDEHKRKTTVQYYIELCLSIKSLKSHNYSGQEVVKRPRVRCQTEEMSQRASRYVNHAKSVYDEREHTLNLDSVIEN